MSYGKKVFFFKNCGENYRLARGCVRKAEDYIFTVLENEGYSFLGLSLSNLSHRLLHEPEIQESIEDTFLSLYLGDSIDLSTTSGFGHVEYSVLENIISQYLMSITGFFAIDQYLIDHAQDHSRIELEDAVVSVQTSDYPAEGSDVECRPLKHTLKMADGNTYVFLEYLIFGDDRTRTLVPECIDEYYAFIDLKYEDDIFMWVTEQPGITEATYRMVSESELNALLYTSLYLGHSPNLRKESEPVQS